MSLPLARTFFQSDPRKNRIRSGHLRIPASLIPEVRDPLRAETGGRRAILMFIVAIADGAGLGDWAAWVYINWVV